MLVRNCIAACADGKIHSRALKDLDRVVVHRIDPELGADAPTIARSFRDRSTMYSAGMYTNGEMPYTFVICEDGAVDQALELSDAGPHARKWNTPGVGVALIGDFRDHMPKAAQWVSLVELTVELLRWLGQANRGVYGHDELPGASADPLKKCPGQHLDMETLRLEVQKTMSRHGFEGLKAMGVSF